MSTVLIVVTTTLGRTREQRERTYRPPRIKVKVNRIFPSKEASAKLMSSLYHGDNCDESNEEIIPVKDLTTKLSNSDMFDVNHNRVYHTGTMVYTNQFLIVQWPLI